MSNPEAENSIAHSLHQYLIFLAMMAYWKAEESGDLAHYRDHSELSLEDLFSDYWDDTKYLFYKAYYRIKDPHRNAPAVQAVIKSAYDQFMKAVLDDSAMKEVFRLSKQDKQQRRRIFDGNHWVEFGEWGSYSAETKERASREFELKKDS